MAVVKEYRFDGPEGQVSLLDLFEGRRQLIVYAPSTRRTPPGLVSRTRSLRELADQYGLAHPGGAWIASETDEGDYHRRAGLRAAGRLLLTTAAASRADEQLIWPALAVCRHFYELQLKELVRMGRDVLEESGGSPLGHRLPGLLDRALKAMAVVWPEEVDEEVRPIRDAVDFLVGLDPTAQVLRYSTLSTGEPSVPEPALLDPVALLDFLEEGAGLFVGAETGMSVWIQDRNEYLSEMAEYHGNDY